MKPAEHLRARAQLAMSMDNSAKLAKTQLQHALAHARNGGMDLAAINSLEKATALITRATKRAEQYRLTLLRRAIRIEQGKSV
jgi:hypothetical protein